MASSLHNNAKNSALDHIGTEITTLSLHTADPGANGTANEVTGGSPAYARKACTWSAAASGSMALAADVTFDVPACTVAFVGLWQSSTYMGCFDVTDEVFAGQGQYVLKGTTTTISLT